MGHNCVEMKQAILLVAALVACSALETKVEADMKYDILSGGEVVPSGKFACQTRCKTECSMVPPKAYPLRTLQLSRHCLNHCGGLCRQLCAKFKVHRICNGCVRQCFQSCALPRDPEKGMCVAKCSRGCHGQCREGFPGMQGMHQLVLGRLRLPLQGRRPGPRAHWCRRHRPAQCCPPAHHFHGDRERRTEDLSA